MKKLTHYSWLMLTVMISSAQLHAAQHDKTARNDESAALIAAALADEQTRVCAARKTWIPFASGIIGDRVSGLVSLGLADYVMAFGNGAQVFPNDTAATDQPDEEITRGGFAFCVPADGTLFCLNVAADAIFSNPTDDPITFTFTLLKSTNCSTGGTITDYDFTGYCATVTFPSSSQGDPTIAVSACGIPCPGSPTSIDVKKGDRIVLSVTGNQVVDTDVDTDVEPNIASLAFQGGIFYAAANTDCPFIAPNFRDAKDDDVIDENNEADSRLCTLRKTMLPWASGLINDTTNPGAINALGLNQSDLVIGFGNNALVTPTDAVATDQPAQEIARGQFAFCIPADGILFGLCASVDAQYLLVECGDPLSSITFLFTLYISRNCESGGNTPTDYDSTGLCAIASLPCIGVMQTITGCGVPCITPQLISVKAGDRLVLEITSTGNKFQSPDILGLSFQAGIFYAPTKINCIS